MELSFFVEKLLESLAVVAVGLGSVYLTEKYKRKKAQLDLKDDFQLKNKIKPILEEIRYELDADRVHYWVFSNGDVTLSGHHLKKLSIFEEVSKDDELIGHQFQLIPAKNFERSLSALYESKEEYTISNEFEKYDDLSALYKLYGVKTVLEIKVKDSFGRWIGVVNAWFKDIKPLDESHIAFAKIQASRIGAIKK